MEACRCPSEATTEWNGCEEAEREESVKCEMLLWEWTVEIVSTSQVLLHVPFRHTSMQTEAGERR